MSPNAGGGGELRGLSQLVQEQKLWSLTPYPQCINGTYVPLLTTLSTDSDLLSGRS